MNSYSNCCEGYSGFFDELKNIFSTAAPIVGGVAGLTKGYETGGFTGAITGGLSGVTAGFNSSKPQVIPQYVYTPTGVPMLVSGQGYTDSLLGTPQQQLSNFYNTQGNAFSLPTSLPTYVYQQPPPTSTSATFLGMSEKTALAAGLGIVALLGLIFLTRK